MEHILKNLELLGEAAASPMEDGGLTKGQVFVLGIQQGMIAAISDPDLASRFFESLIKLYAQVEECPEDVTRGKFIDSVGVVEQIIKAGVG